MIPLLRGASLQTRLLAKIILCIGISTAAGLLAVLTLQQLAEQIRSVTQETKDSVARQRDQSHFVAGLRSLSCAIEQAADEGTLRGLSGRFNDLHASKGGGSKAQDALRLLEQLSTERAAVLKARTATAVTEAESRQAFETVFARTMEAANKIQAESTSAAEQATLQVRQTNERTMSGLTASCGNVAEAKDKAIQAIRTAIDLRTDCMELNAAFALATDPQQADSVQKTIKELIARSKNAVALLPKDTAPEPTVKTVYQPTELISKTLYQMDYYIDQLLASIHDQAAAASVTAAAQRRFDERWRELEKAGEADATLQQLAPANAIASGALAAAHPTALPPLQKRCQALLEKAAGWSEADQSLVKVASDILASRTKELNARGEILALQRSARQAVSSIANAALATAENVQKSSNVAIDTAIQRMRADVESSARTIASAAQDLGSSGIRSGEALKQCLSLRSSLLELHTVAQQSALLRNSSLLADSETRLAAMVKTAQESLAALGTRDGAAELANGIEKSSQLAQRILAARKKELVADQYFRSTADSLAAAAIALDQGVVATADALRTQAGDAQQTAASLVGNRLALQLALALAAAAAGLAVGVYTVRSLSRPLRRAIEQVGLHAEFVSHASGQIAQASDSQASGASEQAAAQAQTAESLQAIAAAVHDNAERVRRACMVAGHAQRSAEDGTTALVRMDAAINGVKTASDECAKLVRTVDEIAFQTNLLALNAAVEAARAGDAGRGFAVVASEVRGLARRSAEAAQTVATLIDGSRSKTEQSVSACRSVGVLLTDLGRNVHEVSGLLRDVQAATEKERINIEQVKTAAHQIEAVTQQTAANAEQSAATSGLLAEQAGQLSVVVRELAEMVEGRARNAARPLSGVSESAGRERDTDGGMSGPSSPSRILLAGRGAA